MRFIRTACTVAVAVLALLLAGGCGSENGISAEDHYQAGMNAFMGEMEKMNPDSPPWEWNASFAVALDHFEKALDQNYYHSGANLMAAVCRLATVMTDPALSDIFEGTYGAGVRRGARHPLAWFLGAPDVRGLAGKLVWQRNGDDFDPSVVGEAQDFIADEVLPALAYADQRLTVFEDSNGSVVITIEVPDERVVITVEIDATDAYFIHTELDAVQAMARLLVSYDLSIETEDVCEILEPGSGFAELTSASHPAAVRAELEDVRDHLRAGCDALQGEPDNQSDDLFVEFAADGGLVPLDELLESDDPCEEFRNVADHIDDALTDGVEINPHDWDEFAPDMLIEIDPDAFFDDPPLDLKDLLPAYTCVDSQVAFSDTLEFPDPTMNGIFPGMDNEAWALLLAWMVEHE